MTVKVAIIDYGCGNLKSLSNAFVKVGAQPCIVTQPAQLEGFTHLVLPGVGAFGQAMRALHDGGFVSVLNQLAEDESRQLLGICLGMQLMCTRSFEHGENLGLNWINAEVRAIQTLHPELKVPHMGWNSLHRVDGQGVPVFSDLPTLADVYFVHSYCVSCKDPSDVVAMAHYGEAFVAAFRRGNIWGMQFHPEKSQHVGLNLLKNFVRL